MVPVYDKKVGVPLPCGGNKTVGARRLVPAKAVRAGGNFFASDYLPSEEKK